MPSAVVHSKREDVSKWSIRSHLSAEPFRGANPEAVKFREEVIEALRDERSAAGRGVLQGDGETAMKWKAAFENCMGPLKMAKCAIS